MRYRCLWAILMLPSLMLDWSTGGCLRVCAAEVRIDFANTNGVIRPLQGVNLGPLCYRGTVDLSAYHRELGIPLTRLHDCAWVNADVVDIHFVFPDWLADPNLPESYDFDRTDDYIQAIINVGSQIVYRLGESIEHTDKQYYVHPPPDPVKWAAICAGVVRHYNEGWASGFHHNLRYWEIWNEPDVRPNMWTGSDEDYLRLYEVTAKTIKSQFPNVKVGGPALGNIGELEHGELKPAPLLAKFLACCRQREVPLDFFSWHRYTAEPSDLAPRAWAVRRLLDRAGFRQTEIHLNEWNYLPSNDWAPMLRQGQGLAREKFYEQIGGARGAAFAAYALVDLQDCPLAWANYYTGEIQGFGLFNFQGVPKKTFYAFKAFKELLSCPLRVAAQSNAGNKLAVCAGLNGENNRAAILLSNFHCAEDKIKLSISQLPWTTPALYEIIIINGENDWQQIAQGTISEPATGLELALRGPSVALIRIEKASAPKRQDP